MDGESFLNYLVQTNKLSQGQAKTCLNSTAKDQSISQTLIEKGFVTLDTLKLCVKEFNRSTPLLPKDTTKKIAPQKIASPKPPPASDIEIFNEIKRATQMIKLRNIKMKEQDKKVLNEVEQLTREAEKQMGQHSQGK
ncbi:MAG: hypothetical protein AABZ60_14725 [Planctomycetota bacterium]